MEALAHEREPSVRKPDKSESVGSAERLVRAYMWPITVVVLCVYFGGQIGNALTNAAAAIGRVDSFTFKDVKITMARDQVRPPGAEVGAALATLSSLQARTLVEHADNSGLGFCFDDAHNFYPAQKAAYQGLEQARLVRFDLMPSEIATKQQEALDKLATAANLQRPTDRCAKPGMIWLTDEGRAVRRYLLDILSSYSFSPIPLGR
jgi:hypothetical protein